jgi:hypothetical protein
MQLWSSVRPTTIKLLNQQTTTTIKVQQQQQWLKPSPFLDSGYVQI